VNNKGVDINTDVKNLDLKFIHHFISTSYWAEGRTLEDVKTCINNSLNFGIYLNGNQIGYARVVTDYVVFAYLMDLFISEKYRKNGYAKLLMEQILSHDKVMNVKVWRLSTSNSHFLYEKFGFKTIRDSVNMMEKKC
jgi:GNAT superfamily N-acetyltransferase